MSSKNYCTGPFLGHRDNNSDITPNFVDESIYAEFKDEDVNQTKINIDHKDEDLAFEFKERPRSPDYPPPDWSEKKQESQLATIHSSKNLQKRTRLEEPDNSDDHKVARTDKNA